MAFLHFFGAAETVLEHICSSEGVFPPKLTNKSPLVYGVGGGITGAHPSSIWAQGMVESTQMLLSMDHAPIHGSLNQWPI